MSDRLRVGVVGAGFMGGVYLAAWAAESNPTVVFSLDTTQAATLAARHGAALARSLDELLRSVDVVDLCTETDRHAKVAIAAARAGRHVICEKPRALALADAEGSSTPAPRPACACSCLTSSGSFPRTRS